MSRSKGQKRQEQPEKAKSMTNNVQAPDTKSANRPESNFPVVALGASAGGLEAFTQFLSKVPER